MKNHKSGQVLLVAVLLIATVLTVTLTLTLKSTTETQLTKLEEDSQKTLSAAEAAVEAALKQGNITDFSTLGLSNFTGSATVGTQTSREFVTPLLQKNQQYTVYLAEYPDLNSGYFTQNINFYFGGENDTNCSGTRTTPALEVTLLYSTNSMRRWVIEPCSSGTKIGGSQLTSATQLGTVHSAEGFSFRYSSTPSSSEGVQITPYAQPKMLVIRALFNQTRIALESTNAAVNIPLQGKTVTSTATSQTGVTKKVQLFQSYPQLPASFFVTSF
ncbi:hypothetical protein A3C28_02670 [Candidatus Roizmanbacteria bacterium RIFCSPHIGHO2_02_FULL_39_9]|uniref:Type 4 fimbrial biogenesis protein PilX N-terminal domain-containing protein n=1 Tax=Candidatus Roizmanbacteria bacterium RIFCSPHIGHO2_02_FULL_39_9 TaxID=1802040 RepID=A0A1F7H5V5_9BACT|nr:MAG: hypothetical protein A3C28_02670 [Candidatus Roizmanbacteria bacterium RIFCSPHIGHO2_02_FULL_39_9]